MFYWITFWISIMRQTDVLYTTKLHSQRQTFWVILEIPDARENSNFLTDQNVWPSLAVFAQHWRGLLNAEEKAQISCRVLWISIALIICHVSRGTDGNSSEGHFSVLWFVEIKSGYDCLLGQLYFNCVQQSFSLKSSCFLQAGVWIRMLWTCRNRSKHNY